MKSKKKHIKNPFLYITPREEQKIANEKFTNNLIKTVKRMKKGILIISGTYGSGKSQYLYEIKKQLKKLRKKVAFLIVSPNLLFELQSLVKRKDYIIIDSFDLILGIVEKDRIIDFILKESEKKPFIIACLPETLNKIKELKKKAKVKEIPPLSLKEAKKLLELKVKEAGLKLNEVFTANEIKKMWEKSRGNPRILIMIAQSMFDAKML